MDLRRQTSCKITKKDSNQYKLRSDCKYLKSRAYTNYLSYLENNPNAEIVQMDTVYNDGFNGPFMQTFKFLKYSFTFIIYHESKSASAMLDGILLLESILGEELVFSIVILCAVIKREALKIIVKKSDISVLNVNVNYIFKKKRNLMFRKNGIIFFRIFYESLEACDSQFAIL